MRIFDKWSATIDTLLDALDEWNRKQGVTVTDTPAISLINKMINPKKPLIDQLSSEDVAKFQTYMGSRYASLSLKPLDPLYIERFKIIINSSKYASSVDSIGQSMDWETQLNGELRNTFAATDHRPQEGEAASKSNCYLYAVRREDSTTPLFNPGTAGEYTPVLTDVSAVAKAVELDLKAWGRTGRRLADEYEPISHGEYKIAIRVTTEDNKYGDLDVHFAVQNADGTWSAKSGVSNSIHFQTVSPTAPEEIWYRMKDLDKDKKVDTVYDIDSSGRECVVSTSEQLEAQMKKVDADMEKVDTEGRKLKDKLRVAGAIYRSPLCGPSHPKKTPEPLYDSITIYMAVTPP